MNRRKFLQLSGALVTAESFGPSFLIPARSASKRKKLRILQWNHPVSQYDDWFSAFARDWGDKNDMQVIVDRAPGSQIMRLAEEEIKAGQGHDLTLFLSPPAAYEKHAIDHREVYAAVQARHGQVAPLAHQSTFNPRTKRYFAFSDCYMPATAHWLVEPWVRIGLPGGPDDYENLRRGAARIKKEFGIPCGLGLGDDLGSTVGLYALLWSFGGNIQDPDGNVTIKSKETMEALKYMAALYRESETPLALSEQPDNYGQSLVSGQASFTLSSIFLARTGEKAASPATARIHVSPPLRGPSHWLSCPHVTSCYVIWKFAQNPEGAKKFLIDLIDNYKVAFQKSALCNLPSFPSIAPDLLLRLKKDPQSDPPYKYMALEDALHWTRNVGYPGYATAPATEVFESFAITRMFRRVATGRRTPAESAAQADSEIRQIFGKWSG